jgi:predicted O-methyltransferase YrrM
MRQVVPPPVARYLAGLHPPVDPLLDAIRAEGLAAGLPLVEPDTARLLRSLVVATGARRILEVGTAIGYSALWMAQAMPDGGMLISMELDPARAKTARSNFERAGLAGRLSVIVGDASRFLHKVAGPGDLIFQDGDKRAYEPMLPALVERLRPGGVLVTDNVLWDGEVVEGYIASPRHDAADTSAIRAYSRRLASEPGLLTTFAAVGDGIAISVKLAGRPDAGDAQ